MRILALILLTSLFVRLNSQTCDTIDNRVVNCIDPKGRKQGLWKNWNYDWRQAENHKTTGWCGTAPLVKTRISLKSKGTYLNDKKTDAWEYYINHDGYVQTEFEIYYKDGSLTKIGILGDSTNFNLDSSLVTSSFKTIYKESIKVTCQNGDCFAEFQNRNFLKFKFSMFDFEKERIYLGVYESEIKKIKN